MGEVEIKIGGFVEQKRLNTMQHINSDIAEVVQDNNDLEYLQKLYEKLHLTERDRDIIDSIFFCIKSRNDRVERLAQYAGMSDAIDFLKEQGRETGPFSTFKCQLLVE